MMLNMNENTTDTTNLEIAERLLSTPVKSKFNFNLICVSKCKRHTLEMAKALRPANKFSRVSEEFLISCEVALKNHIRSRVQSHPSKGKTLM
jgi:hypothetical protein